MQTTPVLLLKDWGNCHHGRVIRPTPAVARLLIRRKIACAVDEMPHVIPIPVPPLAKTIRNLAQGTRPAKRI